MKQRHIRFCRPRMTCPERSCKSGRVLKPRILPPKPITDYFWELTFEKILRKVRPGELSGTTLPAAAAVRPHAALVAAIGLIAAVAAATVATLLSVG